MKAEQETMKMDSIKLIEKLSNANGVSGFEDEICDIARDYLGKDYDISENSLRNLYIYPKQFNEKKPVVMLDAHSDEVGFMAQSIQGNGLIQFVAVGGWWSQAVPAQKVRIRNRDGIYVPGIVATKPPHFMSEDEKKAVLSIDQMFIDVGATCKKEVIEDYGIDIGAPIVPDVAFSFDEKRDMMLGKAFDDRLGCAVVIESLLKLNGKKLDVNAVGVLSAQEEVGTRGAQNAVLTVKPDAAIVLEGSPADDSWKDADSRQCSIKKGPQGRLRDLSMIANPRFAEFTKKTAEKCDIPFQMAVRKGGGTDGGPIHLAEAGVPTSVLSVPSRYIHTHHGFAAFRDYQNTVKLTVELVKQLNQKLISSF